MTGPCMALSASFTVDPLADSLAFLMRESGLDLPVAVTPYGQIFQELLDPARLFARNRGGANVVLVRFEDWVRDDPDSLDRESDRLKVKRNADDLSATLRQAVAVSPAPLIVCVCPPSPRYASYPGARAFLEELERSFVDELRTVPALRVLAKETWGPVDVEAIYDEQADRLGHVPYRPRFFATLAMALARLVHALKSAPHKVLVLDCDNTLWRGVVGEDGVDGIEITAHHRALQDFVLAKKNAGMIVCLASKNVESDVMAVLEGRADMVLKAHDIVAMKVNWLPKSENIRALASELNLGLDSFVFIDDNPLECAEVEAACPGVLAVRLPVDGDFPRFLSNIWALDHLDVTEEDRKRTDLYRQNLDRDRFQKSAGNLADFLAGLNLRVDIHEPREEQIARVSQLTQRTNQFNFTTRRRDEGEIRHLADEDKGCLCVEVQDRFGNYGLVGLMIFGKDERPAAALSDALSDALWIDSLLLSCRVLGRGVEHAMMRAMGSLAQERGLSRVVARLLPTKKNLPARQFLDSLAVEAREESPDGTAYVFASGALAQLTYVAGASAVDLPSDDAPKAKEANAGPSEAGATKSARWNRLAHELDSADKVLAAVERVNRRERPATASLALPRTETERKLADIWAHALNIAQVGIHDDYFDLGGTSLLAVTLFGRIERELGKRFPLAVLVECPTVAALASRLDSAADSGSVVPLQIGRGDGLPVFLVHDADGETLLYRNLAKRLGGKRSVYGIQPHGREDTPTVHTRVEDMAAHYVREVRKIRPHGPYLLGGLCAGGILAFEMARQLEAVNEEARLVAVFDAADVEAKPAPRRESKRRLDNLRQILRTKALHELPAAFLAKARGFAAYEIDSRVRRRLDRLAVTTLRFCLDRNLPLPAWARNLPVRTIYLRAEAEYRPQGAVREEIVLFRATSGEGTEEPYAHRYIDPLLGWGPRTAKRVKVADVPGGHGTMLQEPNVKVIADVIRSWLDAEDRAQPVPLRSVPAEGPAPLTGTGGAR